MKPQTGQSIPYISTPLRQTILALRRSPVVSSDLREASQRADGADHIVSNDNGSQWQQDDQDGGLAHMRQKRKFSEDDPFVTKRTCTGQDSIDDTSQRSAQFPSSQRQPPRGANNWQARSHAHHVNQPADKMDTSKPSARHTVFHNTPSAATSRSIDTLATSNGLGNVSKKFAGQGARDTNTYIKGEASAESSGSAIDRANEIQSTDANSEIRFEEALMRQFRQLEGQPTSTQINMLKGFVRYEKNQVWQAKQTQHLLETQRDSASARYQECLLKQELAESAKLKAESELYSAENSRNKAEREVAEATYTARAATLESERMSKRLESVSNEKIALLAEKDSWKAAPGQAHELLEKDETIEKQKAKLERKREKIQKLKCNLANARTKSEPNDSDELQRLRDLLKIRDLAISQKQDLVETLRAKLNLAQAPTLTPECPKEWHETVRKLNGAIKTTERLQEKLVNAEAIVQSAHGQDVYSELKILASKHGIAQYYKELEIHDLKKKLSQGRKGDNGTDENHEISRMEKLIEQQRHAIKFQDHDLIKLKEKVKDIEQLRNAMRFQDHEIKKLRENVKEAEMALADHQNAYDDRNQMLEKHEVELRSKEHEIANLSDQLKQATSQDVKSTDSGDDNRHNQEKLLAEANKEIAAAQELLNAEIQEKLKFKKKSNARKDENASLQILLDQEKKSRKAAERKLAKEMETKVGLQVQVRRLQKSKTANRTKSATSSDNTSTDSECHSSDNESASAKKKGDSRHGAGTSKDSAKKPKKRESVKVKTETGNGTSKPAQKDSGRQLEKDGKKVAGKKHVQR